MYLLQGNDFFAWTVILPFPGLWKCFFWNSFLVLCLPLHLQLLFVFVIDRSCGTCESLSTFMLYLLYWFAGCVYHMILFCYIVLLAYTSKLHTYLSFSFMEHEYFDTVYIYVYTHTHRMYHWKCSLTRITYCGTKMQSGSCLCPCNKTLPTSSVTQVKVTLVARPLLNISCAKAVQVWTWCIHKWNVCSFLNITTHCNFFLLVMKYLAMHILTRKQ
jgi:hypothetical protein